MKRPMAEWAANVKMQLALKGMEYKDLSEQTGITIDCIKQVMTKDNQPRHRKTICEFVGIPDPGEAQK